MSILFLSPLLNICSKRSKWSSSSLTDRNDNRSHSSSKPLRSVLKRSQMLVYQESSTKYESGEHRSQYANEEIEGLSVALSRRLAESHASLPASEQPDLASHYIRPSPLDPASSAKPSSPPPPLGQRAWSINDDGQVTRRRASHEQTSPRCLPTQKNHPGACCVHMYQTLDWRA